MNERCWCGNPSFGEKCLDSQYHDALATGERSQHRVLYLAGPMSGMVENNYPAFNTAAEYLRAAGYTVVNPATDVHGTGRVHYTDLIREDLRAMLDCHGIALLDCWWLSTGARNEVMVGGVLKMPARTVEEWLHRAATELSTEI